MDPDSLMHLDGLTIEATRSAIRVDYSEPDMGGTKLLMRYRIFLDGHLEFENGYVHHAKLKAEEIEREKLPARVVSDALSWIQEQKEIGAGNLKLIATLNQIETALKRL